MQPLVGIIMGSKSDWETMRHADEMLTRFAVPHEAKVVSAHRTPDWMVEYASGADARGIQVIIAGAGGAAPLPGRAAANTLLPAVGTAAQSQALQRTESVRPLVPMPAGLPAGTAAIGNR